MVLSEISELLEIESNKVCCDCRSKEVSHASCVFGVFICSNCARVHKDLLTQNQRVLPINSEFFNSEDLKILLNYGNESSNRRFEKFVPQAYKRPTQDDLPVQLEEWIRAKYERKEFESNEKRPGYLELKKEGVLWKRGKDNKQFKQRRFFLNKNNNTLSYFVKDGPKAEAKDTLNVDRLNVFLSPLKVGHPFGFQLLYENKGPTRSIFVFADSSEEMISWYTAIYSCKLQWLQIAFPCSPVQQFLKELWPREVKEGWLWKSGPKKKDLFYKRWVSIFNRHFLYYQDPLDAYPKGEVLLGSKDYQYDLWCPSINSNSLHGNRNQEDKGNNSDDIIKNSLVTTPGFAASELVPKDTGEFAFFLKTPERVFALQAESEEERSSWIKAILSVLSTPVSISDQKLLTKRGTSVLSKRISNILPFS